MDVNELTICTYNCKLFNAKKTTFCSELMLRCDFLLMQEIGLFKSRLNTLTHICENISFCGTSSMNENDILMGRPFGGCCIVWMEYQMTKR